MGRPARLASVWLALALAGSVAGAAEVELGIVVGGRAVGDVRTSDGTVALSPGVLAGLSIGWRVRPDGLIEVGWSRQDLDAELAGDGAPAEFGVTMDSLEVGGLWEPRPGPRRPFLAMSLGATRLAGPGQGFSEAWYPSGSLAGGMRFDLGQHAILRLEARATGILLSNGGSLACGVSGGGACALSLGGSLLGAIEARAGVAARF